MTLSLWGAAFKLFQHGLDLPALGSLLGGLGTLIFAIVAASRERRAWLDRRKPH